MSSMTPHDDESYHLAGLAGLYALDALEGEELERFEALLATNAELREEVAGFRATAARLTEVSAAAPPPSLRADVLAAVAATRQDAPVVSLRSHREARTRRTLLAAAAAAAVMLAGLGGYLVADRSAEPTADLAELLARDDTEVVTITGIGTDETTGRMVVSPDTGKVIILSESMPSVPDGRTYELWKIDGTGAHGAGLFEPAADGRLETTLDVDLDGATQFLVTEEPDGGSPQPTTEPLMQATLE